MLSMRVIVAYRAWQLDSRESWLAIWAMVSSSILGIRKRTKMTRIARSEPA
jgi:hypothetical protein